MPQKPDRLGCASMHQAVSMSRRSFVKAGVLGSAGLALSDLLRIQAQASEPTRIKSVILPGMRGGPSHIDMWDMKPDAPAEYRGEFGVINSNVPGIQLSEWLPMCSRMMDKWSIIRSLHHHDAGHSTGDQICFTG